MLLLSGLMLHDLRQNAWDKAEQTTLSLIQVVEQDIARNIEIIDMSFLRSSITSRLPDCPISIRRCASSSVRSGHAARDLD